MGQHHSDEAGVKVKVKVVLDSQWHQQEEFLNCEAYWNRKRHPLKGCEDFQNGWNMTGESQATEGTSPR